MSTVVCHGLQSCLEAQLVEKTTLKLKLAAPKSIEFGRGPCLLDTKENCQENSNLDLGGWTFLQSLSYSSQNPQESCTYIHPLANRSSSGLSEKSLELCTESLGSETGTCDIMESSIFSFSSMDSRSGQAPSRKQQKPRQQKASSQNFPPPLTTIRGSSSLQVTPCREGGRLIIKVVESPSTPTYFQAERSHGRLRLCLLKTCASNFDSEVTTEENEEDDNESDIYDEEKEGDDEEKSKEGEDDVSMSKDMDGNSSDVEVEMGMEKFQRPSRCKEGGHSNKGLCNWESFWVATS